MSAPARLLALRLQGFKSFADRTLVEFGGGISAVVGPNGSGKSNLADALRWALGEQGRALRSRKSEDVIFAGSERRAALGMADVVLVLDNADGLLPVEYTVLELGRRLYRSGENDYLLNKQRVRLKDLVELLDAAHLADNAFLFIGQGMVDQALALRPEERRPLFEEVAGVRRHERRRRRAEEQLAEAEANLARVEDILAELRPQARRLAAQAEQQASRISAGDELAHALVGIAHARWHDGARRVAEASERLGRARAEAEAALSGLQGAEQLAGSVAAELGAFGELERDRRQTHEQLRNTVTALQLRAERLGSDLTALRRDQGRLEVERTAVEVDLARQQRELAVPVPERDFEAEAELSDSERSLAEALSELAGLRAQTAARGDEITALRRAEAARTADIELARRRLADAERRLAEEVAHSGEARERRVMAEAELEVACNGLAALALDAQEAARAREAAQAELDQLEATRQAAAERAGAGRGQLAVLRARRKSLEDRIAEDETRPIARAARRAGGRRLDEELQIEPPLRAAIEAALGEAARGYVVEPAQVPDLAAERGVLVLAAQGSDESAGTQDALVRDLILALGGGLLGDAIRRDGTGAVKRLLARTGWVPTVEAALEVQVSLPPGWIVVTRDGAAVVTRDIVTLGRPDGPLERRAEAERVAGEVSRAEASVAELDAAAADAEDAAAAARLRLEAIRFDESRVLAARRQAEEAERSIGRSAEAIVRESAWHDAQLERLEAETSRLRSEVGTLDAAASERESVLHPEAPVGAAHGAIEAWEARVGELRLRRDRLATDQAERDRALREAEARRARAHAAVALDEDRLARVSRESVDLAAREGELSGDRERLSTELAAASERADRARAALEELRAAAEADRERFAQAEAAASSARDRLRAAEDRLRSAEVADLEARLGLDAVREQVLVELAGLGELGLGRLEAAFDGAARGLGKAAAVTASTQTSLPDGETEATSDEATDDESAALEAALGRVAPLWAREEPPTDLPTAGRLAALRRRYHELGAGNPFAVDEYAALKARLDSLEAQQADLRNGIATTRTLIEELQAMIAEQFRTTFRALEAAFDARFRQLFGGGFARLALTDPGDLSATGVEIVARPPGKKAQALAMLSGGERALTAVALLFAMLEVRPVPFCVLDEVDAALDEANIGRFSDALRSLSGQTQFIVITHNRGTIEAADALYGVTVGDDSVSRVISLRIDEAWALADRGSDTELVSAAG